MAIIGGVGFAVSRFFKFPIRTGPVTLTYWGLWEPEEVIRPLLDEFQTVHPNVKVEYQMQSPPEYRERLQSALSQGRGPDIFRIHNTWIPMLRSSLSPVPENIYTASDMETLFYPAVKSDLRVGSDYYAIPLEIDGLGLFVNNDLLQQAGLSVPQNWDDLRAAALAMSRCDSEDGKCTGEGRILISGAALGNTENVDHWQEILALLMLQNGVDLGNPVGKNAEDALTFFTIFSSVDGVWDATLPTSTQAFAAGKLAMFIAPSWRAFEIQQKNPNLKYKTVPIPQLPKDSPNEVDITYATYWAQGVWSKSPNKSTAWDLLNYLVSAESLQKLYKNESAVRNFGEPYPRTDMAALLKDHPIIGSIITQAPGARSWYLASRTFDGSTGINTQISNYFADAVNAVVTGKKSATEALATVAQGVAQILVQYGISVK